MKKNNEKFDQVVMESLEKKYQIIFDSPNGEINLYLITNNSKQEEKGIFQDYNMGFNNKINFGKNPNLK